MSDIAIIGMACRFPGAADSTSAFWGLLTTGRSAIREIPPSRWSLDGFHDPRPDIPGRSYSRWGGFLRNARKFDAGFFGLSEREAETMDPQQRLALEIGVDAARDARARLADLRNWRTGVFIGCSTVDYGLMQHCRARYGEPNAGTGTALSIIANRVSNRLDLSGPSLCIDTACSSSIVALHTACAALGAGDCDAALAGGVNMLLDPRMFLTFCRAHMLSPSGRVAAFDARADGFVRGEGAGLVLLKRAEDARAAGDRIHALIKATALNQDGATPSITAPNRAAQEAMLRKVLGALDPDDVAYVEAHGTGTPLGDPIEAGAIGTVIGQARAGAPLPIGSVKTNIGHLEPAAGIAGLIKAVLILKHGVIPASLNFSSPNPRIDFDKLGLRVASRLQPLAATPCSLVLVNSFGFGGTNAAAMLSLQPAHERARPRRQACAPTALVPVPLSAPSQAHLHAYAFRLAEAIGDEALPENPLSHHSLGEIAAALARQGDDFAHRAVILARSRADLREKLKCLAEGRPWPRAQKWSIDEIITGRAGPAPKLAFTFTGQGGQFWNMGRDFLISNSTFRNFVKGFDDHFRPRAGWSVVAALEAGEADSRVHDAAITPAVMFALQAGLVEVWREAGIRPDIVFGHSFGEVTAAYCAGALALADVARLVNQRGLIRHQIKRVGAMAAIGMGAGELASRLPKDGGIEIAAYNAPNMVTVSGEAQAIEALLARLNVDDPDIAAHRLDLDFAWHSSWLDPGEAIFKAATGKIGHQIPEIPVISSVSGDIETRFDTDYWWRNLRQPVRYDKAVGRALDEGMEVVVELGPHRTLSSPVAACAAARGLNILTISTLLKQHDNFTSFASALGQLYCAGLAPRWQAHPAIAPGWDDARMTDLPHVPWLRESFWSCPDEARLRLFPPPGHPLLGVREDGPPPRWSCEISLVALPFLRDHRIGADIVFPAAGFIEMMRAAATEVFGPGDVELVDVAFVLPLVLDGEADMRLRTTLDTSRGQIEIFSISRGDERHWRLHARARAICYPLSLGEAANEQPDEWLGGAQFYDLARNRGFSYGPEFRRISSFAGGAREAQAIIEVADLPFELGQMALDPRMLDGALQTLILLHGGRLLPASIDRVRITAGFTAQVRSCRAVASRRGDTERRADVVISDEHGRGLAHFAGLKAEAAAGPDLPDAPGEPGCYLEEWVELGEPSGEGPRRWHVIGDSTGLAAQVPAKGSAAVALMPLAPLPPRPNADAFHDLLSHIGEPGAGVILALAGADDAGPADGDIAARLNECLALLVAFAQALKRLEPGAIAQVAIITDVGGSPVDARSPDLRWPFAGAIKALVRTVRVECAGVSVRFIGIGDLQGSEGKRHPLELGRALIASDEEAEIIIRADEALVPRVRRVRPDELGLRAFPASRLETGQSYAASLARPGVISSIEWRVQPARVLEDRHVRVRVRAVGLNFRDVMAATGLLPREAESGESAGALGLEFAGEVITASGDASGWQPGARVFGMARGCLGRHVDVTSDRLFQIPDGIGFCEAAGLFSAFLSAHYSLIHLARLAAGQCVLIHSASGGVGQAAVQIARQTGARIIASAGSAARREALRGMGITDVVNSRDLGFADEVMTLTGGRGVDVVLNSLSGPFIERGISCIAPYGHFIELGKRDVYADTSIGLKALRANVSLHVVDLAALIDQKPEFARAMMSDLHSAFSIGRYRPLPMQVFKARDIAGAFDHFARARHIGKIGIDLDETNLDVLPPAGVPLSSKAGSYLVTGGTRGFGLALGLHLAARGCARVVLASRSGALSATDQERVNAARRAGADIETLALDVSDACAVETAIARLAQGLPRLKGIIHAAAHYDDALLQNMTGERLARVLAPKAAGGWALTQAVQRSGAQLDFFVSLSSLAQVLGWSGQANYTAANGFLEGLADYQRALGIPGVCLNLGALGQSGQVGRNRAMSAFLESAGMHAVDDETAAEGVLALASAKAHAVSFAALDWARLGASQSVLGAQARLAGLIAREEARADDIRARIAEATPAGAQALATALVLHQLAQVLRVDEAVLGTHQSLSDAGLDSLSSFELRVRIESALGLGVPLGRFMEARTASELGALVCRLAAESQSAEPSANEAQAAERSPILA